MAKKIFVLFRKKFCNDVFAVKLTYYMPSYFVCGKKIQMNWIEFSFLLKSTYTLLF